jgi:hypothetical protein
MRTKQGKTSQMKIILAKNTTAIVVCYDDENNNKSN